jgi:hypothetical protein
LGICAPGVSITYLGMLPEPGGTYSLNDLAPATHGERNPSQLLDGGGWTMAVAVEVAVMAKEAVAVALTQFVIVCSLSVPKHPARL